MQYRPVARVVVAACLCILLGAGGCDQSFNSSTSGSNEGDACDVARPDSCGAGLTCMVWPNCTFAVCCPPAAADAGPLCFCPAPADAGN